MLQAQTIISNAGAGAATVTISRAFAQIQISPGTSVTVFITQEGDVPVTETVSIAPTVILQTDSTLILPPNPSMPPSN